LAALGWIAVGTLCTKVLAEASTLPEALDYTIVAIGVCASCAALIAVSNRALQAARGSDQALQDQVAALKSMADQTPFAESRLRLLALANRMAKRDLGR
jgi:hypothetical protein